MVWVRLKSVTYTPKPDFKHAWPFQIELPTLGFKILQVMLTFIKGSISKHGSIDSFCDPRGAGVIIDISFGVQRMLYVCQTIFTKKECLITKVIQTFSKKLSSSYSFSSTSRKDSLLPRSNAPIN